MEEAKRKLFSTPEQPTYPDTPTTPYTEGPSTRTQSKRDMSKKVSWAPGTVTSKAKQKPAPFLPPTGSDKINLQNFDISSNTRSAKRKREEIGTPIERAKPASARKSATKKSSNPVDSQEELLEDNEHLYGFV